MKNSTNSKQPLVVITTSFPTKASVGGNFVKVLCEKLSGHFEITVIAPLVEDSEKEELVDEVKIKRHPVSPFGNLGLCQGSGIVSNIAKSPWLYLLVPFLIFNQVKALRKTVKETDSQLIHAHWLLTSGLSVALYKIFLNPQINVVLTSHGSDMNRYNILPIRTLKKLIMNYADTVTVVSNVLKKKALELGCRTRVEVIPMGVDTNLFSANYESPINDPAKPNILYVGSVIENKGIEYLIRAFEIVHKAKAEFKLTIVGTGNYLQQAKDLAEKLDLQNAVVFSGKIPNNDLPQFYREASLFVLPSLSEGFPVVISEALSTGLTCVTSNIELFVELSKKHNFIVTAKKKDYKDLAEKILKTLDRDPAKSEATRKEAIEYAQANLDWSRVSEAFCKVYSLLEN